jgi:hypothetical protein
MPEPRLKKISITQPRTRRLQAYAFDPLLSISSETSGINRLIIPVPWEPLAPGPVGEYVEVVDVDPPSGVFYPPIDLEQPYLLAQDGLSPNEENPQFHQQMVYAVVMATIARFEKALGRRVLWSNARVEKGGKTRTEFVRRLRVYPHAFRGANAAYDPQRKALLFGYTPAIRKDPTTVVDGGMVFTCLSHDVIVHETAHAILDELREMFSEPTNPDVLAFHEAIADIMTLLQRFTYSEVVLQQIARTRGDLTSENMLGQVAHQVGQVLGHTTALRDAIGETDPDTGQWRRRQPDPGAYTTRLDPHARGEIMVGAVVDAFLSIYRRRSDDLLSIATGGTSVLPSGRIHPDLVRRLASEVTRAADHVLNMCLRALDYLPPVDVTYGDYLRALVTADTDMVPDDRYDYRGAFLEAFWRNGIKLRNVRSLSVDSLLWRPPQDQAGALIQKFLGGPQHLREYTLGQGLRASREALYLKMQENRARLHEYIRSYPDRDEAAEALNELWLAYGSKAPTSILRDASRRPNLQVRYVRPLLRITPEGVILNDLLILITQTRNGYFDPARQEEVDAGKGKPPPADFTLHGGCTLLVDMESGRVRYAIGKRVDSERRLLEARQAILGLPPEDELL